MIAFNYLLFTPFDLFGILTSTSRYFDYKRLKYSFKKFPINFYFEKKIDFFFNLLKHYRIMSFFSLDILIVRINYI